MPLESGSRVGRIRIDALLGSGGMGEVYRGWDEKLERAVAVKVVHAEKRFSAAMRARFLREARMLSKLDHPNISRIYDVLEREDGDYLILELIEGTTLRDHIAATLPRGEALDIALQVARVLAATHSRGIVHRDLKPDNIMLASEGQVKVLDFGLARPIDTLQPGAEADDVIPDDAQTAVLGTAVLSTDTHTTAGSIIGTLPYMSPEQARGLPLAEPTDIYSLGIVLHEMLSGHHDVYGDFASPSELLGRVRRAEVRPLRSGDRALDALVRRMLTLSPAERPAADEVVRQLEAIRERPARVRRRVVAGIAVAAIAIALISSFFVSRQLAGSRRLFGERASGKLAILPFRNDTGDRSLQWIELGLAELVVNGMRRARGVDVVAVEQVSQALDNLKLRGTRTFSDTQRRTLLRPSARTCSSRRRSSRTKARTRSATRRSPPSARRLRARRRRRSSSKRRSR